MEPRLLNFEESLDDNELLAVFDSLDAKSTAKNQLSDSSYRQIQPYDPQNLFNSKSIQESNPESTAKSNLTANLISNQKPNQIKSLIITEIPNSPHSHSFNKIPSKRSSLKQSTLDKQYSENRHGKNLHPSFVQEAGVLNPQDNLHDHPHHNYHNHHHHRLHSSEYVDSPSSKHNQSNGLHYQNGRNKKQRCYDVHHPFPARIMEKEERHDYHKQANLNLNSNLNFQQNLASRSPLIELPKSNCELIYASEKIELIPPLSHSPNHPNYPNNLSNDNKNNNIKNNDSDSTNPHNHHHNFHHQALVSCENKLSSYQDQPWMNGISSSSKFRNIQKEAMEVLEKGDYILMQGKPYIKKSGWRKIAFFFNLSFEIKDKKIDVDEKGGVLRSEFIVRAIMQNGRFAEAFGACDRWEKRFNKPNHEIPSIAETRAKNRACQDLLGIGEYKSS